MTCGIMKPGVQARPRGQERRQAGQGRVDQHGGAPLGQRADLADRDGDHVGGEGDRLGVEIAAREQRLVAVSGKISGLSDTPFDSISQRLGRLAEQVEDGPHHLRLAAQAVGVLHAVVAVRCEARIGEPAMSRRIAAAVSSLAAVTAELMDAGVERRVRAFGRLGRQARR